MSGRQPDASMQVNQSKWHKSSSTGRTNPLKRQRYFCRRRVIVPLRIKYREGRPPFFFCGTRARIIPITRTNAPRRFIISKSHNQIGNSPFRALWYFEIWFLCWADHEPLLLVCDKLKNSRVSVTINRFRGECLPRKEISFVVISVISYLVQLDELMYCTIFKRRFNLSKSKCPTFA